VSERQQIKSNEWINEQHSEQGMPFDGLSPAELNHKELLPHTNINFMNLP